VSLLFSLLNAPVFSDVLATAQNQDVRQLAHTGMNSPGLGTIMAVPVLLRVFLVKALLAVVTIE
jgi:hypothetical protein